MFNVGIIGAGAFTDFCLEAYKDHLSDLKFQKITDLNQDNASNLAKKYNIPSIAASVDEILHDPNLTIVIILTPPNTHFELARKALEAGKHILIEKPIAFSKEEAETLGKLASEKKLMMTANLVLRYHPFHQEVAETVKTKKYGELRQITTTALLAEYPLDHWYWKPEISGGFFLNTFCHFLDLYSFIANEQPQIVSSTGSEKSGYSIINQYSNFSATLVAYLHASNEQEKVETNYIFDEVTISTYGWLPHELLITDRKGQKTTQKSEEKLTQYKRILASVLEDLTKRISDPKTPTIVSNQDLMNAVFIPLEAEENLIS